MYYAVDFDGVIHDNSRVHSADSFGPPVEGAAEALWSLIEHGNKIYIFTARKNLGRVKDWLKSNIYNVTGDLRLDVSNEKRPADIYIDDHALRFEGDWYETLKEAVKLSEKGSRVQDLTHFKR